MPRITFNFVDVLPAEILAAHRLANKSRPGLRLGPHSNLAVVGGHPNVANHCETLRAWDGDVWAINGAWQWCRSNGIKASFVSCDPTEHVVRFIVGAEHAILARHCDPRCFDIVSDVECFDLALGAILAGPTTATAIPHLALARGHRHVTFFGCGGDFMAKTHAYGNAVAPTNRLLVATRTGPFFTDSGLLAQSEWLAQMLRAAPVAFSEQSGGLLAALIRCPEYDVVAVSRDIIETLVPA